MNEHDTPIASDLSFWVLQKRLAKHDVQTPALTDQNKKLLSLPSLLAQRESFVAEPVTEETNS